jgi:hypothetical protein
MYYADVKIVNGLPCRLTNLINEKAHFKAALRRHLNTYSFDYDEEFILHLPQPFPPNKRNLWYPLNRKLGGPQSQSGQRKVLCSCWKIEPWTIQSRP